MKKPIFCLQILICWISLACQSITAMAQRSEIYNDRIATLQVVVGNDWQSLPVTTLNGDAIHISFDDMTHDYHRYAYRVIHCDADWSDTSDLFANDYISGFNGDQIIESYDESLNTNHLYTHYRLTFPNANCRITISGNYKVLVYDEDNENEPVLSACFMVVDPKTKVSVGYSGNTDIDINKSHQQVAFQVNFSNIRVTDPQRQIKTVVLQNGRWDNAVWNVKPDFVSADGLQWKHQKQLIFPAGNVYRRFELLDLDHPTMGIEKIEWDGEEFHAQVFPDIPRPSYVHDEAAHGSFLIRNSENREVDYTTDYAQVHFTLMAPRQNGDVYLNGDWTYDSFLPKYKLEYHDERKCYETSVLLKQGYYSYQYLMLREDGSTSPVSSEGSFYQTANSYQVLVYYRGTSDRTDQLVGFAEVK